MAGRKPRILDLFCGAGGASVGYERAGFEVVGVDINRQPNYPFEFHQAGAIDFMRDVLHERTEWFDAVHASPPCQGYSAMSSCRPGLSDKYPKLIEPLRDLLIQSGLPYVIENVVGAPLNDPVMLCGRMFGYELYRHRLFETNWPLPQPEHKLSSHMMPASKAGHWKPGTVMSVAGHVAPIAHARKIMDIDWMTRDELGEAIPPYFTEYVGSQLIVHLGMTEFDQLIAGDPELQEAIGRMFPGIDNPPPPHHGVIREAI